MSKKIPLCLKSKRLSCEDIVIGYRFTLTDAGRADFHCAFCGGKGVRFFEVTRNDGKKFKVGGNCLGRVDILAPKDMIEKTLKKPTKSRKTTPPPKVEPVLKSEEIEPFPVSDEESPMSALDEFIDSLRKDNK